MSDVNESCLKVMYIITHTPDGKCKNCTEDEDVVEHCQTYQKFVKSFTKFLPCHYNDGDGVAWIYSKLTLSLIKRICDTLPSLIPPNTYQVFRQCQREKTEFLPPKRRKSIKKWKIVDSRYVDKYLYYIMLAAIDVWQIWLMRLIQNLRIP